MQLKFDDLTQHLRQTLKPWYVLSGDEPMQLLDARDQIVAAARARGFLAHHRLDMTSSPGDSEWHQAFAGGGLFADKALVEIRCEKSPDKATQTRIAETLDKELSDTCVVLTLPRIDKTTEKADWFRKCLATGVWIPVWPVEGAELPAWLQRRARERDRNLSRDAAARMAELVEGNLLAARQALALLCFVTSKGDTIGVDTVEAYCADNARFSPWQVIDLALAGEARRLPPLLRRVAAVDDPKMLMARSLQNLFEQLDDLSQMSAAQRRSNYPRMRIWSKRQALFEAALKRHPASVWNRLWVRALHLEYMVTGRLAGNFWDACLDVLLVLAGVRLRLPYREISS